MAMSLNKVMLIGNLTREPELKTIPSGQIVATFGIATNRTFVDKTGTKQEHTEFHDIVVWGKLAEICGQYLGKGRKVYIEGRLQTREWDGQDGLKRRRTEIVADNVIMLDRAPSGTSGTASGYTSRPASDQPLTARPQNSFTPKQQTSASDIPTISLDDEQPTGGFKMEDEVKIEDIPF